MEQTFCSGAACQKTGRSCDLQERPKEMYVIFNLGLLVAFLAG
jgi:hypothetical protein